MNKNLHLIFIFLIGGQSFSPVTHAEAKAIALAGSIDACQIFPDDNFWNIPIDNLPVHANSSQWVTSIGSNTTFHMDFGSGTWNGGPIGIPLNIVSGASVNDYSFDFYYPSESDVGPYPLPASPEIEWGSDHHILTVDTDDCSLYELYDASYSSGQWYGGSGAIWSLNSNDLRPDTWTSADAAGLPILPGLARYEEVLTGEILHALRFTANCTANYYIWPAKHKAQSGSCATPIPFGARFRLKSNYDISGFSPQAQVILQAFKTYGIVLADNGSNWYVSGSPSESWDNDQLHEMDVLTGSDFEAVDTSGLMSSPDSAATLTSVHFAAIGDFGNAGQPELDVSNLVKSWNPDFVITLGDNNYNLGEASTIDQNIGQYYHEFIYPYSGSYGPGSTYNQFFPALGNHDWYTASAQAYLNYFALPGNERYYDFIKGPVQFFVVDSDANEPDGITSSSTQAQWLQNALANSTAAWNIVYLHHAPYSSSAHGSNTTLQWPYAEWGADAVLAGHDHSYERIYQNGIPYFVNGLGGKSIYSFGTPISGSQFRYNDDYGAMLIDADNSSIVFKFIDRNGTTIDTHTLSNLLVTSITSPRNRSNQSPSIDFTVTFTQSVTGVDETDFQLIAPGLPDAVITGVSGSGASYIVSINTGSGKGSVHLNLIDNDTIVNDLSSPLGGAGLNNGDFTTGDTYPVVIHLSGEATSTGIITKSKSTDKNDSTTQAESAPINTQSDLETDSTEYDPFNGYFNKSYNELARRPNN